jgi:hypothetical protein
MRGKIDALGTSAAAFHRRSGESLHVFQVPFRIGGIAVRRNANGNESEG